MKTTAPYGTWKSPITPESVAGKSQRLAEPKLSEHGLFWLESRPDEKGRTALMFQNKQGEVEEILGKPWSVFSKAHEYGGGAYTVADDHIYFVNAEDQDLYRINWMLLGNPIKVNKPSPIGQQHFADLHYCKKNKKLYAVCEHHKDSNTEAETSLVNFDLYDPDAFPQAPASVQSGKDFYSNPKTSPCGKWLSYLSWSHPNMPWDQTVLSIQHIETGQEWHIGQDELEPTKQESIFQPQWSPEGSLYWVSDRSNWWNIYRIQADKLGRLTQKPQDQLNLEHNIEQITSLNAEFATPQWVFGMSTYGFLNQDKLFATFTENGIWQSCTINCVNKQLDRLASNSTTISDVNCLAGEAIFIGANPSSTPALFKFDGTRATALFEPKKQSIDDAWIAKPTPITFTTSDDAVAHAFYYAPQNPNFIAPENCKPPVIVICHGGPTGATSTQLNFKIQFWTSRGFGVLDVNYRGSTGYGRQYRHSLYKKWGIADVDDICAGAQHLVEKGLADPSQLIVKGSSAGGYTVLAALAFRDTFSAGVSLYGIGNLETLATDTHKFEARYLDKLVGPYPAAKQTYLERSPIFFPEKFQCPLLIFQGLKDKVVPPNQAEKMVSAATACKLPVAYVTYEEEGHGFRQAETISHMLNAELYFYQQVLLKVESIKPAPIEIENLAGSNA